MAMLPRGMRNKKEKITISIDAALVQMVDAFVSGIKAPGYSRSAVFEEALQMWKQSQRDQFDVQYYTENAVQLNDPDWTAITTKAADHIWKD